MKSEKNRIGLVEEFYAAHPDTYFKQPTLCAVLHCSPALAERDRWAGTGVPFIKIGRRVLYKKSDVLAYLSQCQK